MSRKSIASHYQIEGGAYTDLESLSKLRYAATEIDLIAISHAINPLSGLLTSSFRGRGIDFAEVRAYQPGDDVLTIDWRVTARTQKPHTKLFQEEKERPVFLVLDQSSSMFFGSHHAFKSVLAAQCASLLAWTALEQGDRVGGLVFSDTHHREVRPKRNKKTVMQLLREIHAMNQELGTNQESHDAKQWINALISARRVAKHGSTIFIISDFLHFDDESKSHLSRLSRHNDLVGILIADPLERSLPRPNLYTITDGQVKSVINTANPKYRDAYSQQFEMHQTAIAQQFEQYRAPLFVLFTDEPIVDSLANQYNQFASRRLVQRKGTRNRG